MKNQAFKALGVILGASVIFAGCNGLGKMVKKAGTVTYTVTPNPVEAHGDSITFSVSGKYPPKYFAKKAALTITPEIKYEGGARKFKPVVVVGEKSTANGTKINYKAGGSFSYTSDKVAYEKGMETSVINVTAVGAVKSKTKDFPAIKIADGAIITPMLVLSDEKPLMGKDKFVKVIPVSQTGSIYYVVNQSTVRPGEMNNAEMKALKEFIALGVGKGYNFKGVSVSAYASPDGEMSLNENLAADRASSGSKALMGVFKEKKTKVEAGAQETFYNKVTTAEDWEGFKAAIEASTNKAIVADRDLIIRVLTMYSDLQVREKEIKNLAQTYTEISDEIMPKLRRSVLTVNAEQLARTDEQILRLAASTPDSLSVEEILYAATLTTDINQKLSFYQAGQRLYANDWRTHNNVGYVLVMQNKVNDAEAEFNKAKALDANNPIIANNLGLCAAKKGDRKGAMELYDKASSAGSEVNYNRAIIYIKNGDYANAVTNFGSANSFNVALAKLLNGTPDAVYQTIDASTDKDLALSYYLKAVAGARQGKADVLNDNLKTAIQKDASLKEKAKGDAEFIKFRDNADFKAATM